MIFTAHYLNVAAKPQDGRLAEVRPGLHVELGADGMVIGVRHANGPVDQEVLVEVLRGLRVVPAATGG